MLRDVQPHLLVMCNRVVYAPLVLFSSAYLLCFITFPIKNMVCASVCMCVYFLSIVLLCRKCERPLCNFSYSDSFRESFSATLRLTCLAMIFPQIWSEFNKSRPQRYARCEFEIETVKTYVSCRCACSR